MQRNSRPRLSVPNRHIPRENCKAVFERKTGLALSHRAAASAEAPDDKVVVGCHATDGRAGRTSVASS
jgi:hypothetical protein